MRKKEGIKFKTLHKRVNVKSIIIGVLLITLIILVIANRVSHASFTSSLDVPFVRGKINYKHPDFKVMAMYVQESSGSTTYNETNTMPSGNNYVINASKSYCNKGNTSEKDSGVVLKTVDGNHVMNNLTKNDRCFLYFDKVNNVSAILAKYTKDNSRSGELNSSFRDSTPTTVYSKEDDDGTSYVFAGEDPNNWVKIGNMDFQIIRFNGNGSMRLLYSGTSIYNVFNTNYNDNMYVGLQYTSGQVHGKETNSTILGSSNSTDASTLYGWYNNNIKTTYESLIDSDVGFCSDRDVIGGDGIGKKYTSYGANNRYLLGEMQTSYTPTLKCKNSDDLLKLPVGLITADEYVLAGGAVRMGDSHSEFFWLDYGDYWTMTPYAFNDGAYVFYVYGAGYLDNHERVDTSLKVLPVINLKSSTIFESGDYDGSAQKPWTVKI